MCSQCFERDDLRGQIYHPDKKQQVKSAVGAVRDTKLMTTWISQKAIRFKNHKGGFKRKCWLK